MNSFSASSNGWAGIENGIACSLRAAASAAEARGEKDNAGKVSAMPIATRVSVRERMTVD
jgi:hypothetical protein